MAAEPLRHPTIAKPPDLEGAALAWQVNLGGPVRRPEQSACVGCWIVYAPWAHAFWHTWVVDVVHLRDVEGQAKPPFRRTPESAHEFMVHALDPDSKPDPDHPEAGFAHLHPVDVVEQWGGTTDEQAQRVLLLAVRAIVAGRISPDSDYRRAWREVIAMTVTEVIAGIAPEG